MEHTHVAEEILMKVTQVVEYNPVAWDLHFKNDDVFIGAVHQLPNGTMFVATTQDGQYICDDNDDLLVLLDHLFASPPLLH